MMMIGSSNILFSLSASRLPKPGDETTVQGTRRDFGSPGDGHRVCRFLGLKQSGQGIGRVPFNGRPDPSRP